MTDQRLVAYRALVEEHPELFVNPGDGLIVILLDADEISAAMEAVGSRLETLGLPRDWAQVGVINHDQYGMLLRDAVRFTASGDYGTYHRYLRFPTGPPGVAILPLCQGKVVLVRHFRHATRRWHLEIPRGFGESGEGEADARRELDEEIQATPDRLVYLGHFFTDAAFSDDPIRLFFAEIPSYGDGEAGEGIAAIISTPVEEFEALIADGEIDDGFTLAAFARARARRLL